MLTASAPEIKRHGFGIIDKALADSPVCIIRNNRPTYIVMGIDAYREMEEAATLSRVAASEEDILQGRTFRGSADDLMSDLAGD